MGVVVVIRGIMLKNSHLMNMFVLALRLLSAIKYRELINFIDFLKKKNRKKYHFLEGWERT